LDRRLEGEGVVFCREVRGHGLARAAEQHDDENYQGTGLEARTEFHDLISSQGSIGSRVPRAVYL
jgi:hypothetical protein